MTRAAVVMGGSAGSLGVFDAVLGALPEDYALPLLLVLHLPADDAGSFALHLAQVSRLPVVEPCDKQRIEGRHVYTAPANYHMLVERGGHVALSVDERVNWSRPSIDVLFESAAGAWGRELVAVILSGANADGAMGLLAVKAAGGHTLAQDPAGAASPLMPLAAIKVGAVDEILSPEGIALRLIELANG